ncbi:MAG: D-alanine--D-alanine ligase, partial [Gammaproteobacteria bacterium]
AGVLHLQGEKPRSLPVIEIVTPKGTWYDYEHRYTPGLSEHIVPARLPEDVLDEIGRIACEAHAIQGCKELSRADFVVDADDRCYLLEVNTLPGMTPTSLYPDAARAAGLSFEELMRLLVTSAWQRRC